MNRRQQDVIEYLREEDKVLRKDVVRIQCLSHPFSHRQMANRFPQDRIDIRIHIICEPRT